jgi:DNA-directed RNA polymerase specialized sigma24 family protein
MVNSDDWSNKTSDYLAEVIRQGSPDEVNAAIVELRSRLDRSLHHYLAKKLPFDWVEDIMQEIWDAFQKAARIKAFSEGAENYLWGIARRKRASSAGTLRQERSIETDSAPIDTDSLSFEPEEDVYWEQRQLLHRFLFVKSSISDCQRFIWLLRKQLELPSSVVRRLTGKTIGTIDTAVYSAQKRIGKYFKSEEYYIDLACREMGVTVGGRRLPDAAPVIERFAEMVVPRLTEDEVKTGGLDSRDFYNEFSVSLIATWTHDDTTAPGDKDLHIILKRHSDGREYMAAINLDNDNIAFKPQVFSRFRDPYAELKLMDVFASEHKIGRLIPSIMMIDRLPQRRAEPEEVFSSITLMHLDSKSKSTEVLKTQPVYPKLMDDNDIS